MVWLVQARERLFTVIQRIKYMLEQGIKPDTILCLTFSDAAANEMRTRLSKKWVL